MSQQTTTKRPSFISAFPASPPLSDCSRTNEQAAHQSGFQAEVKGWNWTKAQPIRSQGCAKPPGTHWATETHFSVFQWTHPLRSSTGSETVERRMTTTTTGETQRH